MPAKPNYEFLKRQKEQAKQKKKEEKRLRKLQEQDSPDGRGEQPQDESSPDNQA
jgi:hypothetical protein